VLAQNILAHHVAIAAMPPKAVRQPLLEHQRAAACGTVCESPPSRRPQGSASRYCGYTPSSPAIRFVPHPNRCKRTIAATSSGASIFCPQGSDPAESLPLATRLGIPPPVGGGVSFSCRPTPISGLRVVDRLSPWIA
jgi:hypothetical protein